MDNLINMSDHEKVIFVTGIDEKNNPEVKVNTLSSKYPFAVFFTTNDQESEDLSYPVMNIWKGASINGTVQGVRLTRFVGIDEENNELQIGDHTVKLLFDYNTGKLGLYDANKLERIEIVNINYINLFGQTISTSTFPTVVSSKDNKFNLTLKFISSEGNAKNISNIVNVDTDDFILLSKNKLLGTYLENDEITSINNEYVYQIVKDTYKNHNNKQYEIVSAYSSDKYVTPQLGLLLNPISYIMTYNNLLLGSLIYEIGVNTRAKIDVSFEPSSVTSYDKRKLYLKVISNNVSYVTLGNGVTDNNSEILIPINDGSCSFNINTAEQIINNDQSVILTFEVYRLESTGIGNETNLIKYDYLTTEKTIILTGNYVDTFWYAGYDNPFEVDITNKLIPFNSIGAGNEILYDWNDTEKSLGLDDINSKFYIAIPNSYKDVIKPRWDGYVVENSINYYIDCSNWFTTSRKNINNIDFIIYESKFMGKFYGKIQ